MDFLPARVPTTALNDLAELFVSKNSAEDKVLELKITTSSTDFNVRGFAAYLAVADGVYGRLTKEGLRSYSQTPSRQLRITEIRQGSLEIIIREVIAHYTEATPFAVLWLFLKYLPGAVKSFSEAAKNFADAYKSVEDAKLTRENRKRLREEIKEDGALAGLEPSRINQLVILLEDLQAKEAIRLVPAAKFAKDDVKSVELVVVKKQD